MIYDSYHNLKAVVALKAATYTTAAAGEKVDLKGYQSVLIAVESGTITAGTQTFRLTESDDNTTFTDVVAADLLGTAPVFIDTDDDTVKAFGYIGNKRYIKLEGVVSGTSPSGTFGAIAIFGTPLHAPV